MSPIHPAIQDGESPILAKEDWPNTDHLITEDGKPVDNLYSERQMRLLTETLYSSWKPGIPFLACANVGLFYINLNPAIVPDVFVSVGVEASPDLWSKGGRSYLQWEKGKPPDVVIEIVSNREGGELTTKRRIYAENVRAPFYVVWDPEEFLKGDRLQAFILIGDAYQPTPDLWFSKLRLGLKIWHGPFENSVADWLRWIDADDHFLETGDEQRQRAEEAQQAAEDSQRSAEAARSEADAAQRRAKILAAKLKELGIDPDAVAGE